MEAEAVHLEEELQRCSRSRIISHVHWAATMSPPPRAAQPVMPGALSSPVDSRIAAWSPAVAAAAGRPGASRLK